MKDYCKHVSVFVMMSMVLISCATQHAAVKPGPACTGEPVQLNDEYVQKVDDFLIILDSSESMSAPYAGQAKLDSARRTVCRMNKMIPDIPLDGGLRTFGRGYKLFSINATDLIYGMTAHNRGELAACLSVVTLAAGNTPLATAIDAGTHDVASADGDIAVIIISDGKNTTGDAVNAAGRMKAAYGDRVCIYTIVVGDDPAGRKTLLEIARKGVCGFLTSAEQLASPEAMASFVTEVFLAKKPKPWAPVAATPVVAERVVLNAIQFDFDSAVIKSEYVPIIDEAAVILKKYGNKKVFVEGHTCAMGSAHYNQGLSLRRSASVKKALVERGIAADRLTIKGYGEEKPVADNGSLKGRRMNRRVEFKVLQQE